MPTTGSTGTAQMATDTTAYDTALRYALRAPLDFSLASDVEPVDVTHKGVTIQFNFANDLAAATTPLTELADVSPVALSDTTATVTIAEYGNVTSISAKLRGTAYLSEMKRAINVMGRNGSFTFDTLARDTLLGATNVIFPSAYGGTGTNRATIAATDTLKAKGVRAARRALVNASVEPWTGELTNGLYKAWAPPDAILDLREETGAAAWREPHVNAGNPAAIDQIWRGVIATFEGFMWTETSRLDIAQIAAAYTDGGAGAVDVYPVVMVGREAMVKAYAQNVEEGSNGPFPVPEMSPMSDNLNRFKGVGWFWLGGFGRFREAAIRILEVASSVGVNV